MSDFSERLFGPGFTPSKSCEPRPGELTPAEHRAKERDWHIGAGRNPDGTRNHPQRRSRLGRLFGR